MRLWTTAILVLLLATCKERSAPRPEREPQPLARQTRSAQSEPLDAGVAEAGADASVTRSTPSAVVRQRERVLTIPAEPLPQRIAFSRRRLAWLTESRLVVWDLPGLRPVANLPVEQPRAILAMADGAFVVVTNGATRRLAQHETSVTSLPRLYALPGVRLWPDRRDPLALWAPTGRSLYGYRLPTPDEPSVERLLPVSVHEMQDYDEKHFVGLKDGAFLFTAGDQLKRLFPGGKSTIGTSPIPTSAIWRLVPARRIDQIWAAQHDGTLKLLELVGEFRVVQTILGGCADAFDIASNERYLALVRLRQPGGQPRSWSIRVMDAQGKPVFEYPLPPGPRPDTPDWVSREVRDRSVALAPDGPYVAVGGPTGLAVWNTETRAVELAPEAAQRLLEAGEDSKR